MPNSTAALCDDTIIGNIYTSADRTVVLHHLSRLEAKLKKQKQFAQDVNCIITHGYAPAHQHQGRAGDAAAEGRRTFERQGLALLKLHLQTVTGCSGDSGHAGFNEQTQTKPRNAGYGLAPSSTTSLQGYGTYRRRDHKSVDDTLAVNACLRI
ncbi:hypothetical protein [Celeribacter halophilus]|uniref:hypothetical protein n=1 Tax=Celeribacter halophilus TaxID=576117 RepID=UPI003A8D0085